MLHDLGFRHRALGAVIGSAVGDALGAPFEFGNPREYSERFPRPVISGIGEMIGNRRWDPGEFTDDTQMAIFQFEMPALQQWSFTQTDANRIKQPILSVVGSKSHTLWKGRTEVHELVQAWWPRGAELSCSRAQHTNYKS